MKFALITDLHANRPALEEVFAHAAGQQVDRYAFLGDLVGYGGDPSWVVDQVRARVDQGGVVVMGNHDLSVLQPSTPTMNPDANHVISWTREQLNPSQLEFLQRLPYAAQDGELLFVHANAYAPAQWDYLYGTGEAVRSLQATSCRYTFCGHVHEPALYHLSGTGKAGQFTPTPDIEIPLSTQRRWLAVPGSAGQPRDGNPAACYAVFDSTESSITFHRVPYDVDAAAARIRAAGLPPRLAQRLVEGR